MQKSGKNRAKRGFIIFIKVICWIFVIIFSPVFLIYFMIRGIVKLYKKRKFEKANKHGKELVMSADISDIDIMSGYMFEEYLEGLLTCFGFKVELTSRSRDYGADLIITKNDIRVAVQAKRYNKLVGVKCVQEVLAAKCHYNCSQAMVISSSHFTQPCEQLAKENGVELIDRDELIDLYKGVKEKLKVSVKEGELAGGNNNDIEQIFPHMI